MRRFILWDIDGTLIRSGGVGESAINAGAAAAAALLEVPEVAMSGKTDPQILREIFLAAEIDDDRILELLPRAVVEVERALAAAESDLRAHGMVLPGVVEVLDRLAKLDGTRQSLVTGNLVANAAVKVAAFDLAGYFDVEVGAYGTDDSDRNALVPIAVERAAKLRSEFYEPEEVWVVGDTPRDLECARAAGVRCLLVGTGAVGLDGLRHLGADAVLPDLTNVDEAVHVLTASAS